MKNKCLILFLSAVMCNSAMVMPVMAAQETESIQTQDEQADVAATEDNEPSSETDSSAAKEDASQSNTEADDTFEDDTFVDVEERKAIDDKAAELQKQSGYEPIVYPGAEEVPDTTSEASSEDVDDLDVDYDTVDVEALTGDVIGDDVTALSNVSSMDASDYFALAIKMEDAKDGETVSSTMTYSESGMYFDIDTLAGLTDYRGAFTIDVVDDSNAVLYTLGFSEDAWKEENILDLAVATKTEDGEPSLAFNSVQELPFTLSIMLPSVKANTRYVLVDESGNEYNLQTSDENGKIVFELSELRKYSIKDASGHEYDGMDTASSAQNEDALFLKKNWMVIAAVAASACMILAACFIPARKRRKR